MSQKTHNLKDVSVMAGKPFHSITTGLTACLFWYFLQIVTNYLDLLSRLSGFLSGFFSVLPGVSFDVK